MLYYLLNNKYTFINININIIKLINKFKYNTLLKIIIVLIS